MRTYQFKKRSRLFLLPFFIGILMFSNLTYSHASIRAKITVDPSVFNFKRSKSVFNSKDFFGKPKDEIYNVKLISLKNAKINIDYEQDGIGKSSRINFLKQGGVEEIFLISKGKILTSDKPISNIRVSYTDEGGVFQEDGKMEQSVINDPCILICEPSVIAGPVKAKNIEINFKYTKTKMISEKKAQNGRFKCTFKITQ